MEDKRATARRRVLKSGRIVFNHGLSVINCTVRDLSERGARLRLPSSSLHIPNQLNLALSDEINRRTCRVVWRSMHELGVTFEP
jgi:hypothetical protein